MMNAKELEMMNAMLKANEELAELLRHFENVNRDYMAKEMLGYAENNLKRARRALEELEKEAE